MYIQKIQNQQQDQRSGNNGGCGVRVDGCEAAGDLLRQCDELLQLMAIELYYDPLVPFADEFILKPDSNDYQFFLDTDNPSGTMI